MSDQELIAMARLAQHDDRLSTGALYGNLADRIEQLAATCEELVKERDEALNQLDSARHSVDVLEKRLTDKMAKLAKAVEALRKIADYTHIGEPGQGVKQHAEARIARAVLAELEVKE